MQIGFYDSGIGGINVLQEALEQLPNENYIYYADTLHVPYGTKPKEEVKKYIFEAVDFIGANQKPCNLSSYKVFKIHSSIAG